ncbi:MAG: tetratricopeptide repeat protein, partial [Bacteroidota bacterium]
MQLYRDLLTRFPSSEFRATAEERLRTIETFEAREKDAGVEKLALLLGDVVGEKDKVGLSFRLGEIYFNDLKNYSAAAAQFSNAINSGMNDSRFVDALYLRARSLEYLSWKDSKHAPQAIEAYQVFLKSYPDDPRLERASLSLFALSASSLASAHTAYAAALTATPDFRRRDLMLQRIGVLQEKADSAEAAIGTYASVLQISNDPAIRQEAAYRRIPLLLTLGLVDSALKEGTSFLSEFQNGPHSAEVVARIADLLVRKAPPTRLLHSIACFRMTFITHLLRSMHAPSSPTPTRQRGSMPTPSPCTRTCSRSRRTTFWQNAK